MQYCFTLNYQLADSDADLDELINRLADAGCDDALIGIGLPGRMAIEFTRSARSAQAAMTSALSDVRRAMPLAKLIEVAPDFVGLSDAAEIVGVSRQNLRKLMVTHHRHFPPPVHAGSSSVWHLEDLITWLQKTLDYKVPPETLQVACAAKQVNLAKQATGLKPGIQRELSELLL